MRNWQIHSRSGLQHIEKFRKVEGNFAAQQKVGLGWNNFSRRRRTTPSLSVRAITQSILLDQSSFSDDIGVLNARVLCVRASRGKLNCDRNKHTPVIG